MTWLRMAGYAFPGVLLLSAAHKLGIDPNGLVTAILVGSPVLAVGLAMFLAHAWRQNSVTALAVGQPDAEPAAPVGQPSQASPGQMASRPGLAKVTAVQVTSLASEPGQAPAHAVGQLTDYQPTEPLGYPAGQPEAPVVVAKASEAAYTPWEDTDGDD